MVDLISKADKNGVCYIITVENPDSEEKQLVAHAKGIIDHNRTIGNTLNEDMYPDIKDNLRDSFAESTKVLDAAMNIIQSNKRNRTIVDNIKKQILTDIEDGKDIGKILICAAEAISRLETGGDSFVEEVTEKIQTLRRSNEKI